MIGIFTKRMSLPFIPGFISEGVASVRELTGYATIRIMLNIVGLVVTIVRLSNRIDPLDPQDNQFRLNK